MMKKRCIFTCLTGNGYDTLNDPIFVDHNYDYICFTNNTSIKSNVWKIQPLPIECYGLDDVRKNRYVKWHSHVLLKEYDSTIYIDSNVVPVKELYIDDSKDIMLVRHPFHIDVWRHLKKCLILKKDNSDVLERQCNQYDFDGYIMTYNGIIYRKNTVASATLNEEVWQQILEYSTRDQLASPYVIHKLNLYDNIEYVDYNVVSKHFLMLLHSRKSTSYDSNIDIRLNKDNKIAVCCYIDQQFDIERYVSHYLSLGFDKIIFYDTIGIDFNNENVYIIKDTCSLHAAYNDCHNRFKSEFDYIAYLSHNEWLKLLKDLSIKDFLNRKSFDIADIIAINWKVSDISIYRNINPYMIKENRFIKPIIRTSAHIEWTSRTTHLPQFSEYECLLTDSDGNMFRFNYDGFLMTYSYDHAYIEYNRGEKSFSKEEIEFYDRILNIM